MVAFQEIIWLNFNKKKHQISNFIFKKVYSKYYLLASSSLSKLLEGSSMGYTRSAKPFSSRGGVLSSRL